MVLQRGRGDSRRLPQFEALKAQHLMKANKLKQSGIARLLSLLGQAQHPYQPATEIFLGLNADRIAEELQLAKLGAERGAEGRPAQDALTLDDIEHQVIESIETHKNHAHSLYIDQQHTYDERLNGLNFEERFTTIQQAAPEAVSDFKAEAALGRDDLHALRRKVLDSEQEREIFRSRHRLARPARLSTPGKTVLKVGVLAILFVLEVVINGSFLAQSNIGGLLGGAVQAVSFAALNILVSFLCGLVPIRLINRRGALKLLGFISLLAFLAFAGSLNLTLAHLREIPPSLSDDIGHQVLTALMTSPLTLNDINSWVLFGIGFTFSIVAMADGLLYTDPYFGYGSVERRWIDAQTHYTEGKAELIERLKEIRDTASQAMNDAARDLSVRRSEYDAIVQARSRLNHRFGEHQSQIERTARTLLAVYREANRKSRKTPAPAYFTVPYALDRITYASGGPEGTTRDHLFKAISESQELLKVQVQSVHAAFDEAVRSYGEIDQFISEKPGVPPSTQVA